MTKHTMNVNDKIKFYQKEDEFSFIPDSNFMVSYKDGYSKTNENDKKKMEMNYLKTFTQSIIRSKKSSVILSKVDLDRLSELILNTQNLKLNQLSSLLPNQLKFMKEFFFNLWLKHHLKIISIIEYIIWAKFFINLCIFQFEQPINYAKEISEETGVFYFLFWIDCCLTLLMIVEILFKIFIFGVWKFLSRTVNLFDTTIVLICTLSFITRLLHFNVLARLLSPFTYLRILSVLYVKWRLFQIICIAILSGKNQGTLKF